MKKIRVEISIEDLSKIFSWMEICGVLGYSEYAMNEGLMFGTTIVTVLLVFDDGNEVVGMERGEI